MSDAYLIIIAVCLLQLLGWLLAMIWLITRDR